MLTPKRVKHRKWRKRASTQIDSRGTLLEYGSYGLKGLEAKWITARQLEAGRRVIVRFLRKGGKMWIRIFPDKPVTKKGAETPMGGGKGSVDHYVCPLRPGRIIFEIEGLPEDQAREALKMAAGKLPVKTTIITR
ncbi:MAG: 50S ribosomal protein L16 [bacterium]|nr:50S ribosomal protein L16 [bacterium]